MERARDSRVIRFGTFEADPLSPELRKGERWINLVHVHNPRLSLLYNILNTGLVSTSPIGNKNIFAMGELYGQSMDDGVAAVIIAAACLERALEEPRNSATHPQAYSPPRQCPATASAEFDN